MKICFLSLNAYPTLAGTKDARVGGAEVQQVTIAYYLVEQGYEVSFVTIYDGEADIHKMDKITVYRAFERGTGLPYLRFFYPRGTGIWRALHRANADIYYQRCASMETGILALFCKVHGKKFIFASASDSDFKPLQIIISSKRDKYLYNYGLRHANAIVAQTETQKILLQKNYGLNAKVIPNCWKVDGEKVSPSEDKDGYVLWVSTLRDWKRPLLFLDLAEEFPGKVFVMVGGAASGEQHLYDEVQTRASTMENVRFEGFVSFYTISDYFDGAMILVNTSEPKEGFPNTFLQAWQRGVPVVSYFDPDKIISNEKTGVAVSSKDEMKEALRRLVGNNLLYKECQNRAKDYFENNHRVETIGARYETVFQDIVRNNG